MRLTGRSLPVQTAVQSAQQTSEKLKQQVTELAAEKIEGERTAITSWARKNAATAQRKVAGAILGVGNADNAFSQLNRLKLLGIGSEGRSHRQSIPTSSRPPERTKDLEAQFATLGTHSVDAELEALKKERQKPHIPKELPAANA